MAKDETNYDEAKVPAYDLPDPLVSADGKPVAEAETWFAQRRPELLRLFETEVFGKTPEKFADVTFNVTAVDNEALGGAATSKRIIVNCTRGDQKPQFEIVLYLPRQRTGPAPVFVGMMLFDKAAASPQPGRSLAAEFEGGIPQGIDAAELPGERLMQTILDRGYGIATLTAEEIAPDSNDRYLNGVLGLARKSSTADRTGDEWGAIGAWAWALSRALDYFETDPDVDAKHVAAIGHSRNGKTALWAGAQEPRFALVISNNSGCGGAALGKRRFGETVRHINDRFPFWFCPHFRKYNDRESELPIDQHELLALIAPRLLYVASAEDDNWADPRGEFLATLNADPVFRLVGQPGLGVKLMPPLNRPVGESVGYHLRSGKHNLTDYDWMQYLKFADRHWGKRGSSTAKQ